MLKTIQKVKYANFTSSKNSVQLRLNQVHIAALLIACSLKNTENYLNIQNILVSDCFAKSKSNHFDPWQNKLDEGNRNFELSWGIRRNQKAPIKLDTLLILYLESRSLFRTTSTHVIFILPEESLRSMVVGEIN